METRLLLVKVMIVIIICPSLFDLFSFVCFFLVLKQEKE